MPKITPFLWYDNKAEEAVDFYLSVFKSGKRLDTMRNNGGLPQPKGSVVIIPFELEGQQYMAFNGGPAHTFNEAFSMVVHCTSQEEIDHYWNALIADGGSEVMCGWCKDKFGLRWQVIPQNIGELIRSPAAMNAMLSMIKLDISVLEAAARE